MSFPLNPVAGTVHTNIFTNIRYTFDGVRWVGQTSIPTVTDELPPQANHSGELLTTDGTVPSWAKAESVVGPYTQEYVQGYVPDYVQDRMEEAFGRLIFFFDGELGNDTTNTGTTAQSPFKSLVGLKRKLEQGLVVAADTVRNLLEEFSGGSARSETDQFWVLRFKTSVELYFKNVTAAGVIQTYTTKYAIQSTQSVSLVGYSSTPGELTAGVFPKLPKLNLNGYFITYSADHVNAGYSPYLTTHSVINGNTVRATWIDIGTHIDKRVAENWSITAANFQTFATTVPILLHTEVNFELRDPLTQSVSQYALANLRYQTITGAVPTDWAQAITWCEQGALYSVAINALSTSKFSKLYTNPHMATLHSANGTAFYWCTIRIRDGSMTYPQYHGLNSIGSLTLYGTTLTNERTPGAGLKGAYYGQADVKSKLDVTLYSNSVIGFTSMYDALTDITLVNMSLVGAVNPATNRLYYPNMHFAIT